jgi:ubiquinone/menaquinone biosynthesis C-methylase UbiE
MFTALLHRLVAHPWVYDLAQSVAGAKKVRARLADRISPLHDAKTVLDIGGGTGSVAALWSPSSKYICLDIDPLKLEGFVSKNPTGTALLADATRIPIADESVDAVLCTNVTHHLTDSLLDQMLSESRRILTGGGKLILSDALWAPNRRVSRTIWKYDRGSFPRTPQRLQDAVSKHLGISSWEQFAIWHEYFICVAGRAE